MVAGVPAKKQPQRRTAGSRPKPRPSDGGDTPVGDWESWLKTSRDPEPCPVPRERPHSMWRDAETDAEPAGPRVVDRTGSNPGPGLRRRPPRWREGRLAGRVIGLVAFAVTAVVVVVVVLSVVRGENRRVDSSTVATASMTAMAPMVADEHAAAGCRQSRAGLSVSGTGPGGFGSGPDVILAFERGYYVDRDAVKAKDFLTGNAEGVGRAGIRYSLTDDFIRRGINDVPRGTKYCVQIEPDSPDRWRVHIVEETEVVVAADPLRKPITAIDQLITTVVVEDGRTLIATIAQR